MKILKLSQVKSIWIFVLISPILLVSLILLSHDQIFQVYAFGGAVLFYLTAALLYHLEDRTLTLEIALEYILIAVLSMVVVQNLRLS